MRFKKSRTIIKPSATFLNNSNILPADAFNAGAAAQRNTSKGVAQEAVLKYSRKRDKADIIDAANRVNYSSRIYGVKHDELFHRNKPLSSLNNEQIEQRKYYAKEMKKLRDSSKNTFPVANWIKSNPGKSTAIGAGVAGATVGGIALAKHIKKKKQEKENDKSNI